jgi:PIN domain nuclease of toxin-antitoxin system
LARNRSAAAPIAPDDGERRRGRAGSDAGRRRVGSRAQDLDEFGAEIVSFDFDLAMRAAALEGVTRLRGLSLGDRVCLALAQRSGLPAITMDKAWAEVAAGAVVRVVR